MIDIPIFLRGEDLGSATKEAPAKLVILEVEQHRGDEKPYVTKKEVIYEILVELNKEKFIYTPNNASLRNMVHVWGRDESQFTGKVLKAWAVWKDVFGEQKLVIYSAPAEMETSKPKKTDAKNFFSKTV